jgi:tetratricopeptide (TPR) repeat protein
VSDKIKDGELLFAKGHLDEAKSVFEEVLAEQPDRIEALNNLGVIAVQQGDFATAKKYVTRALELQPDFLPALGNLAVVHKHEQNWQGVIDCLEPAMAQDASNLSILNLLGLAYLRVERLEEARDVMGRSLEIQPNQPTIRETVEAIQQITSDDAEETVAFDALRKPDPADTPQDTPAATPVQFRGGTWRDGSDQSPSPATGPAVDLTRERPNPAAASLTGRADEPKDTNPLDILFVQEAPCIRNYKTAKALRERGHRVSLAYTKAKLSQVYPALSDDVYTECIHLGEGARQLWDISSRYDIIHCHNEPDTLSVAAMAGDAPVVHDTHDLISLREQGNGSAAWFEGVANRGADGRVYSTPYQRDEAARMYGAAEPSLVFYNYASRDDVPATCLPKLSALDGRVHIVYEGGVGGTPHRDFGQLFCELAGRGFCVHVYPTFAADQVREAFSSQANIEVHPTASPREIIREMTQYDFGIIPFNLEKGNKRFLDSTIANKLFEYLAASLPVIASPLQSYVDYFRQNPVGVTCRTAGEIEAALPQLREIAARTDFGQQLFTYEGEVDRMVGFYRDVIERQGRQDDAPAKVEPAAASTRAPAAGKEEISIEVSLDRLVAWLDSNGWDGYDPYDVQDYLIQHAKRGTPLNKQQANEIMQRSMRDPMGVRRELGIAPQRNNKGLGLLTAARVRLYKSTGREEHLREARALGDWLMQHPSGGIQGVGWGYPFDWQSVQFIPKDTPSAVVSTVVGDGLWELYTVTRERRYLEACEGVCRFITEDLNRDDMGERGLCFSYTPIDDYHVHNANLFCGEFLARIGRETGNEEYWRLARRTADYALSEQNPDGSIFYWGRVQNHYAPDKLDHYHTGFEIRSLWRMAEHLHDEEIALAAQRYLEFYLRHFLEADGLPKITPSQACPVNIHGAAEGVLMLAMLSQDRPELLELSEKVLRWTIRNMQLPEGWFGHLWTPNERSDAPYLRWGQAWMLRAMAEYCCARRRVEGEWGSYRGLTDVPGRKARDNKPVATTSNGSVVQRGDVAEPTPAALPSHEPAVEGASPGADDWRLGVDVDHPIMIVGVGRSGTTLLQAMFNAHPNICLPPESHFVRDFIANPEARRVYERDGLAGVEQLLRQSQCVGRLEVDAADALAPFRAGQPFDFVTLFKRYLALYASREGKSIVGEKDPSNTHCLQAMREAFPHARVIHIIRDPRDVVLSRLKTDMGFHKDVEKWARNYATTFDIGRRLGSELFGEQYVEVHYEDLITGTEPVLRELCSRLGVPFDPAMMHFQEDARKIVTSGEMNWKENVLKPVLSNNCGKWRSGMAGEHVRTVESICGEVFEQTPYERSAAETIETPGDPF